MIRRLKNDSRGAISVEFALISIPFATLMFGMIEVGLSFFAATTLENGVVDLAREVRTGRVQSQGIDEAQVRTFLCGRIDGFLDCGAKLVIDMRSFADFEAITVPPALDEDGNFVLTPVFEPGAPGDVVVVRVFYRWPVMTPVAGEALSNMRGGERLLSGSAAFRNEPFGALLPED